MLMVRRTASMPWWIVTDWHFLILTLFSWQDFQRTELFFPFVPGGVSKHSGPVNKQYKILGLVKVAEHSSVGGQR